jgi:hypothetical protein
MAGFSLGEVTVVKIQVAYQRAVVECGPVGRRPPPADERASPHAPELGELGPDQPDRLGLQRADRAAQSIQDPDLELLASRLGEVLIGGLHDERRQLLRLCHPYRWQSLMLTQESGTSCHVSLPADTEIQPQKHRAAIHVSLPVLLAKYIDKVTTMLLAMVGDVMVGRNVGEEIERRSPDSFWGDTLPILRSKVSSCSTGSRSCTIAVISWMTMPWTRCCGTTSR